MRARKRDHRGAVSQVNERRIMARAIKTLNQLTEYFQLVAGIISSNIFRMREMGENAS